MLYPLGLEPRTCGLRVPSRPFRLVPGHALTCGSVVSVVHLVPFESAWCRRVWHLDKHLAGWTRHSGAEPIGLQIDRHQREEMAARGLSAVRSAVRLGAQQCRDVVEDGVLARERKPAGDGYGSDPPVGLVILRAESVAVLYAPVRRSTYASVTASIGGMTPALAMSRSSTPRRRAPHPATSAPNRSSATTVKGRTQVARSSSGTHRALRCE
jgi:hypothetical protein